ncbi:hypothetical protein QS257_19185 [Terrilactibacillus sp. S3-3]|nr:hypothetical protein QS257_19185 [Terrilactibacillus sp. S3-3]
MESILFVCTGNTCRSPMAEALMAHKAANKFRVQSAGLFAMNGAKAHPYALKALALEKEALFFSMSRSLYRMRSLIGRRLF